MTLSVREVVVAVDLTPRSPVVASAAGGIAEQYGAKLTAVHIVTVDELAEMRSELPQGEQYDDVIIGQLRERMAGLFTGHLAHDDLELHVEVGDPTEQITRFVSNSRCDLVVMGVRSRSRVGKLLLGSVTQEVLLEAGRPVLCVPTSAM